MQRQGRLGEDRGIPIPLQPTPMAPDILSKFKNLYPRILFPTEGYWYQSCYCLANAIKVLDLSLWY